MENAVETEIIIEKAGPGIDPEILRQLKAKAQVNRDRRMKRVIGRGIPIVYVPTGTTLLRFYMDSENNITRTFLRHKIGKMSVPCLNGCPLCTYLSELDEKYPDVPGAWRLRPKATTIAYAWIFSCSEDSKFVKTETPVLLMGNHKLGRDLEDHIADMDEEEFAKMLDPRADHVLWELKSGNNGRDFSLAPSFKTGTMDPLPDALYPLSQCVHPEGREPTAVQISKFIEIINRVYEGYIETAA
jgi:hypothetical protein